MKPDVPESLIIIAGRHAYPAMLEGLDASAVCIGTLAEDAHSLYCSVIGEACTRV